MVRGGNAPDCAALAAALIWLIHSAAEVVWLVWLVMARLAWLTAAVVRSVREPQPPGRPQQCGKQGVGDVVCQPWPS
eukprot:SAG25_NODE_2106_length_1945_cov_1.539003_2_plen_77_part_00